MDAASRLRPRRFTRRPSEPLIGLLAATGMRIGEALALDDADVDLDSGVITATGKWDKQREIPLHPTTVEALREYRQTRDRYKPVRLTDVVLHLPLPPAADPWRVREVVSGS